MGCPTWGIGFDGEFSKKNHRMSSTGRPPAPTMGIRDITAQMALKTST